MGMGIVAMHYTGMAALKVEPAIVWDMFWVAISVIIALTASFAALWLTFRLRHEAAQVALMRFGAAILMGIAIAGMHYSGMMAARFPNQEPMSHHGVNGNWLAVLVSVVAFSILGITYSFPCWMHACRRGHLSWPRHWQKRTASWPNWRYTIP
jgi:NO-binding membrane sensor protein with MHYT domain